MTLRTRLVALLIVLAASGMMLLGAITYISQKDYQNSRIDEQTRTAETAVSHQLDSKLGIAPASANGSGPRPVNANANLPSGTYGQRRAADGTTLASTTISYGEQALPAPKLPAQLADGRLITVGAVSGGLRYRVRADVEPNGQITIVAVPLAGVDAALHRLLLVEGTVIGGVLLLLALLARVLVRVELRPLQRIGTTADAIAAGELSRRVDAVDERTEVGRLGVALNRMLGRLEDAFAEREASDRRLRAFLSDASHELRTPLASIRGYAELFRMGAATDPDGVSRSMRRIEEEARRMGVLVEDLLTLARLDELPALEKGRVDMAALVRDAAADARAVAPDRPVEVVGDGAADVVGNADALRQVIANLVRNALVHTPAGSPLELSSRQLGERVEIGVRDHGPGLPTDRPEELFERFWRGEGHRGRERGKAGAGLGLSIVAAIVAAHGGEIRAADAPGGGACFTVLLPLERTRGAAGDRRPAAPLVTA